MEKPTNLYTDFNPEIADKKFQQGMQQQQPRALFKSEDDYFKNNPTVTGMATEDGNIIINPYSSLTDAEKRAVMVNESARLYMRKMGTPNVSLTREQESNLAGTSYATGSLQDQRATILARLLSGDPSGGVPTMEQQEALKRMMFLK